MRLKAAKLYFNWLLDKKTQSNVWYMWSVRTDVAPVNGYKHIWAYKNTDPQAFAKSMTDREAVERFRAQMTLYFGEVTGEPSPASDAGVVALASNHICYSQAVMQLAIDEFSDSTQRWLQQNTSGTAEELLTRFVPWTLSERSRLNTEYELFVAAVSRPLLRPCAMNWLHVHETLLMEHLCLSPEKARAAVSFIDAWLMRGILDEPETVLAEDLIRTVFRAIVNAPQAC